MGEVQLGAVALEPTKIMDLPSTCTSASWRASPVPVMRSLAFTQSTRGGEFVDCMVAVGLNFLFLIFSLYHLPSLLCFVCCNVRSMWFIEAGNQDRVVKVTWIKVLKSNHLVQGEAFFHSDVFLLHFQH